MIVVSIEKVGDQTDRHVINVPPGAYLRLTAVAGPSLHLEGFTDAELQAELERRTGGPRLAT